MKAEIQKQEERIRLAQLANDFRALDELISDRLQFVFFNGSVADKKGDIEAHKNKVVLFKDIVFSEQRIEAFGDSLAVVTVKAEITGEMGGSSFHGLYRYSRTWAQLKGKWQVIGGCVTQIPAY